MEVSVERPLKKPYSNDKCRRHPTELAAICDECYDRALAQQMAQRKQEQEREHERYLRRLSGIPG